ncbi:MAG: circularly permuted type 2 ATP-grasp protein [Rhodocyclales bacterium]|nr:circularly permuted type 2 ATP-grasp protein [Rhodocyclales bacterium]
MPRTLLHHYARAVDRYDEILDPSGRVRAHWKPLYAHLNAAPPDSMRQRIEFADRCIEEDGVAYNVYADPKGQERPWALDPLPLVIPAQEWRGVVEAVAQRARLLNAMLADLYNGQTLLAEGLLPPALIYGQHGYLWPCTGAQPPGGVFLHQYAVDLARAPDGQWWAIADRTQAPSGAGYALENRLIVSRVFPDLFRDLRVQHLAAFFRALQEGLEHWAPVDQGERPLIVLLTPGPYNETYFEHAYLARYLGYPLVEGQDLTVRGDTVFLKTLTGLKRVHAILRRQDDSYCDPLELRGDSALGIPGLLVAVRARRVMLSNALGSGLPESGAIMGFLPAIARRLLGEELLMPSVATWWCGEKPARDYVLANLDKLVIKGAYPTQQLEPIFGRELNNAQRDDIVRRITTRPHAYAAQELVNLSQAPVWSRDHGRRLLARSVGLRVYAVATPHGYQVMPGGLTRAAGRPDALVLSMQRGGAAKDTWVLADGPISALSLLTPVLGVADLVRSGKNLSSRVVENLFWFGRYTERLDDTARLLRVALARLIDSGGETTPDLQAMVDLCIRAGVIQPGHDEGDDAWVPIGTRLVDAVYDVEADNSLAYAVRQVLWSAAQIRERLSLDHWHSLNRLQHNLQAAGQRRHELGETLMFLDQVLQVSSSLTGYSMDNMTRDIGWGFLVVGRRIERLAFLASTLGAFLRRYAALQDIRLDWLLELTDSIITYRSRYSRQPELLAVVDLVVFDERNPHSVLFQLQALLRYSRRLATELSEIPLDLLDQEFQTMDGFGLWQFETQPDHACTTLAAHLDDVATAAGELSDVLGMRYFTHVDAVSHQTLAR